jgi:hypothetical protein
VRFGPLVFVLALVACAAKDERGGDEGTGGVAGGGRNYVVKSVSGDCLPRPLVGENGVVPCTMIEAELPPVAGCSCDASRGRAPMSEAGIRRAVEEELTASSRCGGDTGVACASYCMCEIVQLSGAALEACRTEPVVPDGSYGYCYVEQGVGDPSLLAGCPATQMQRIRFVGDGVPGPGAAVYIACSGASTPAQK